MWRDGRVGRRRSPAKRVYWETGIEGSNPSLSATLCNDATEEESVKLGLKRLLLIFSALAVVAGCSKNENKDSSAPAVPGSSHSVTKKEAVVAVPPSVKGKWKAVKISVTNKSVNKDTVYTVAIGKPFKIPDSDLTITVDNFLPHFVMEGTTLTSQSNEPKNPAAQVRITETDREIFKGWLFALYPTTHAFQHPKYGFTLVDFLPAD